MKLDVTLLTDIAIHMFILFTFLALFFFFYIAKIEKKAFEDEFGNIINDNLPEALHKADAATGGAFKKGLQGNTTILDMLHRASAGEDVVSRTYNGWLMIVAFSISGVMLLMITSLLFVRSSSCNLNIPLKKILVKNLISFVLVAMIEGMFFVSIASKFGPAMPSQLITDVFQRIKTNLQ